MEKTTIQIRRWIIFFMLVLVLSGLTTIPVEQELSFLIKMSENLGGIHAWLERVYNGFMEMKREHPFLVYGYDWLAFAHIILAILFIGPYRDPVKNIWVIEFGMIACVLVVPFAIIAGQFRGIP